MPRLILTLALVILAALIACSGATPASKEANTPAPTQAAAPAPAATPASTSTPVPTAIPTQTTAPTVEPEPGEHVFIAGDYELSVAELACFSKSGDPGGLARALNEPGSATQEQQATLIGCLEDETLDKLFLAGFVGDSGPLSSETSACIQEAFDEINPRAVMTAGTQGNPGAAMAGSMAGFSVTQACLNDEEWEAQASQMGIGPAERQGLQCLMRELGGPAEMAAAMKAAGQGGVETFSTAGMACGLDMGTGPPPGPAPGTATPEPPSKPTRAASTPTPAPTATTAPPTEAPEPATTLVIKVASIPLEIPTYSRSQWKHWQDHDGDCQDARQEALVAESVVRVGFETERNCRVETGRWYGAFTGTYVDEPGDLDVDHLVPLKNAHLSGAWQWSPARKEQYANDLLDPDHLIAVTKGANRSKGAKGPEDWRPPDEGYWCQYAVDWTEIKEHWGLTMTEPEAEAVVEMLGTCEDPPEVEVQAARVLKGATQEPEEPASESSVYSSCEAAEAAGEQRVQGSSGVGRGFPKAMVSSARDGDGDGIVCEK